MSLEPDPAPKLDPEIEKIRRAMPGGSDHALASFNPRADDDENQAKVDAIEMMGEEVSAGFHKERSEVSAGMRYLHCSRTIHQLITDRNRAVGLLLGVASLLLTASGALCNANPKGLTMIPSRPFNAGACRSPF